MRQPKHVGANKSEKERYSLLLVHLLVYSLTVYHNARYGTYKTWSVVASCTCELVMLLSIVFRLLESCVYLIYICYKLNWRRAEGDRCGNRDMHFNRTCVFSPQGQPTYRGPTHVLFKVRTILVSAYVWPMQLVLNISLKQYISVFLTPRAPCKVSLIPWTYSMEQSPSWEAKTS
jgi:hypothetical protein